LLAPQNALNKAVVDLLEGSDKTAHQIITLTGGKAGSLTVNPGQVLFHERPEANWSYIPAGDIEKLIRLKNDFIVTIAQLGQVPLSYFQVTGQVASAETQQADDTGLVAKAEDMAVSYGNAWEDVMGVALRLSNEFGGTSYPTDGLSTLWGPFDRIDKMGQALKRAEIVTALVNAGATLEGAAIEAGYGDESVSLLLRGDTVEGFEETESIVPASDMTALNGAQIRAALDLMASVAAGQTSDVVGIELLMSLGLSAPTAQRMIDSAKRDGVAPADGVQ
jgi:hypothetical protein